MATITCAECKTPTEDAVTIPLKFSLTGATGSITVCHDCHTETLRAWADYVADMGGDAA